MAEQPLDALAALLHERRPSGEINVDDVADALWEIFVREIPEAERHVLEAAPDWVESRRNLVRMTVAPLVLRQLVRNGDFKEEAK